MVAQRQAPRRGRVLGGVRPTSEDHRATTFELFFDLVYVFAVTQVTGYMAAEHSGHGVLQGLLLLTLLWWTWSGYTWLGNQARADEGLHPVYATSAAHSPQPAVDAKPKHRPPQQHGPGRGGTPAYCCFPPACRSPQAWLQLLGHDLDDRSGAAVLSRP